MGERNLQRPLSRPTSVPLSVDRRQPADYLAWCLDLLFGELDRPGLPCTPGVWVSALSDLARSPFQHLLWPDKRFVVVRQLAGPALGRTNHCGHAPCTRVSAHPSTDAGAACD